VLQCSGDFATMQAVADALPPISDQARARLSLALAELRRPEDFDPVAALAELQDLVG